MIAPITVRRVSGGWIIVRTAGNQIVMTAKEAKALIADLTELTTSQVK